MSEYQTLARGQHNIFYHTETFPHIEAEYFSPDYWQRQNAIIGHSTGRGVTWFFAHQGKEYVLRHYLRGGLVSKLLKDQYWFNGWDTTRSFAEARLLATLGEKGLAVPRPAGALVTRSGPVYRADIILERIPEATDFHHLLLQQSISDEMWYQAGQAIQQLHRHQVYHHDLNIHNILADHQGKIWLIDFDQCGFKAGEKWKQGNLERLLRSVNKEKGKFPHYHWRQEDWQTLLEGYKS